MLDLQLVNAPLTIGYRESSRTGTYPPLNLASIAGFLRTENQETTVEIIDGELHSCEEICDQVTAPVVGISSNIMTYPSALRIAEAAHARGSKVVFGGPYPTSRARLILAERPFVDAVVTGDGEIAMRDYLRGLPDNAIPNLSYRRGGAIFSNVSHVLDLNTLPFPDYVNLPIDRYFDRYEDRYSNFTAIRRSLAVYSRKGCVWRDASDGGCVFCMIPHKGLNYKTPARMWEEIEHSSRQYCVNHFWEVCDTFTENSRWLDDFLRERPAGLDVTFTVYGRASNISRRMAKTLDDLGVVEVFIGAESGDDDILARMNKGIRVDQTRRAVQHLAELGIRVVVSFVYGLPGETSKTLEATFALAEELLGFGNVIETSASILLPIPGSKAFDMLMREAGMAAKHDTDVLDLEDLKRDWIARFTNTTPRELETVLHRTLEAFPLNNTFMEASALAAPMC